MLLQMRVRFGRGLGPASRIRSRKAPPLLGYLPSLWATDCATCNGPTVKKLLAQLQHIIRQEIRHRLNGYALSRRGNFSQRSHRIIRLISPAV